MSRRLALLAVIVVIVAIVAFVACSGDDADTPTSTTTTTTTTVDPGDEPAGEDEGTDVERAALGEPDPAPTLSDEDLQALADGCAAGELVDCDELYFGNLGDQVALDYGATCGGRLDEGIFGQCVTDHGPRATP